MEAECITNIKEEADANSECECVVSNITILKAFFGAKSAVHSNIVTK